MEELIVKGNPLAQKRHRHIGKFVRVYDPSSKDKKAFASELKKQWNKKALNGNILLFVTYHMPRPKNHYRTGKFANILKKDAPEYHKIKPDIDNLIKLTMDASTGILWKDDCVVVGVVAKKRYSKNPRTEISIMNEEEL